MLAAVCGIGGAGASETVLFELTAAETSVTIAVPDVTCFNKLTDRRTGRPVLQIRLGREAAAKLASLTRANVGRQLEIRREASVLFSGTIQSPILGGTIVIDDLEPGSVSTLLSGRTLDCR